MAYGFNGAAALGAAEICDRHRLRSASEGFNGAAALGAAEIMMISLSWEYSRRFNGAAALGAAEMALAFHLAETRGCTVCCENLLFGT